jgi:hypothetical protein
MTDLEKHLSDEQLFDFDQDRLVHFDLADAKQDLAKQGEAFRPQLVMARWIEGWRERMAENYEADPTEVGDPKAWQDGFDYATRELAAHLRQGDFLPRGVIHDEEVGGR